MVYKIDVPKEFDLKCQTPFCENRGDIYRRPDWEGEEKTKAEVMCCECAPRHGFCSNCGIFAGGLESFEFGKSGLAGLCINCWDSLGPVPMGWDEDDDDSEF
jgi:hypothetical protein